MIRDCKRLSAARNFSHLMTNYLKRNFSFRSEHLDLNIWHSLLMSVVFNEVNIYYPSSACYEVLSCNCISSVVKHFNKQIGLNYYLLQIKCTLPIYP